MALIGRFIEQILPVGSITLIQADGGRETYGPGGSKHVSVRLHDRRAALELFRNPRLRLGELYMDGRLTIEDGSLVVTGNYLKLPIPPGRARNQWIRVTICRSGQELTAEIQADR